MKKLITLILTLFFIILLTGCSNNSVEEMNQSEPIETSQSNATVSDVQSEKLSDLSSLYPVSDILDGDGIEGTWINRANENNIDSTMVLALNSDRSFNFFVEIITPDSSGTAKGFGSYTVEGDILKLNFDKENDGEDEPVIIDDSEYVFALDDNILALTNSENELVEYIRVIKD